MLQWTAWFWYFSGLGEFGCFNVDGRFGVQVELVFFAFSMDFKVWRVSVDWMSVVISAHWVVKGVKWTLWLRIFSWTFLVCTLQWTRIFQLIW